MDSPRFKIGEKVILNNTLVRTIKTIENDGNSDCIFYHLKEEPDDWSCAEDCLLPMPKAVYNKEDIKTDPNYQFDSVGKLIVKETTLEKIVKWLYVNDGVYADKNEWRKEFINFLEKIL